jgi:hypothetical protein
MTAHGLGASVLLVATCAGGKRLKTLDTRDLTHDCVISTTTLISVSSRTGPHALGMVM